MVKRACRAPAVIAASGALVTGAALGSAAPATAVEQKVNIVQSPDTRTGGFARAVYQRCGYVRGGWVCWWTAR